MIPKYKTDPPRTGARGWGANRYFFTKAIHLLREGFSQEEILEAFLANEKLVALAKPGELERQISQAGLYFNPDEPYTPKPRINYNAALAAPILKTAAGSIERLQEGSPRKDATSEEVIDSLFPDDSWICCGKSKELRDGRKTYTSHTFKKGFWLQENRLSKFEFIIPNPMKDRVGETLEGRPSPRCKSNVLERRFIVVESDVLAKAEQAAILLHLSKYASLALAVDSGGKSIHGFFYCGGVDEDTVMRFFDQAVLLGADEADRTISQFARLPGGTRANGARQTILHFNPEYAQ